MTVAAAVWLSCCTPVSTSAASINVPPNPAAENSQEEKQQSDDSTTHTEESATASEQLKTADVKLGAQTSTDAAKKDTSSSTSTTTTCRWGEHCPDGNNTPGQKQNDSTSETEHHIPFVPNKNTAGSAAAAAAARPPEGFHITSRVYTDPDDKLAHFDTTSHILLEYLECGARGSTTSPLQIKNAYFRHAMPKQAPHLWSGTEFGTHPQLLIPLKPLELLLNSGEQRLFEAGDVILLEDVLAAGHKIRSPNEHQDMSALLLTLPQHYHHVGKDRVSLTTSNRNKAIVGCETSRDALIRERIRKTIFAGIGLGLSSFFAVFLGKVAPLWLSVGVGGTCFIVGGTYATVQCGEYMWQEGELAVERRWLKAQYQQDEEEILLHQEELLLKEEQAGR